MKSIWTTEYILRVIFFIMDFYLQLDSITCAIFFEREREKPSSMVSYILAAKKGTCTSQSPIFNSHLNSCQLLSAQNKKDDKIKTRFSDQNQVLTLDKSYTCLRIYILLSKLKKHPNITFYHSGTH